MEKPNYNKNIKELKLSIQVRLDGLSFLILDARSREVVWYEKTSFQGEFTPPKVLQKLEDYFQKEAELKSDFTEVVLLFSNDLYSLVPEDFFIEEEASNFLKFNTRILKTDVLAHDHIAGHKMVNVYIPYTNITNYIFDKFGEFEFKHSISVFIEAVLNFDSGENTIAYLHAFSNYYHLVIVKEGKLLYAVSDSTPKLRLTAMGCRDGSDYRREILSEDSSAVLIIFHCGSQRLNEKLSALQYCLPLYLAEIHSLDLYLKQSSLFYF